MNKEAHPPIGNQSDKRSMLVFYVNSGNRPLILKMATVAILSQFIHTYTPHRSAPEPQFRRMLRLCEQFLLRVLRLILVPEAGFLAETFRMFSPAEG